MPVIGYTWFPMFTMIDWRYRHGQAPLEHYRLELGLYRLSDDPAQGRWNATPLVEQMRIYIADSDASDGALDHSTLAPALKTDACKAHSRAHSLTPRYSQADSSPRRRRNFSMAIKLDVKIARARCPALKSNVEVQPRSPALKFNLAATEFKLAWRVAGSAQV